MLYILQVPAAALHSQQMDKDQLWLKPNIHLALHSQQHSIEQELVPDKDIGHKQLQPLVIHPLCQGSVSRC